MPRLTLALIALLLSFVANAADNSVTLTCDPPTKNTDGSNLTDLAKFRLYGGLQGKPKRELDTSPAPTCKFLRTNLATGTQEWYVTALNASGAESDPSSTVTKVIVADVPPTCPAQPATESRPQACIAPTVGNWTQSRTYTSVAAPACWEAGPWMPDVAPAGVCASPPTLVTAGSLSYMPSGTGMTAVGLISAGLPCGPDVKTVAGVKYCRIVRTQTDFVNWPADLKAVDIWAKAAQ